MSAIQIPLGETVHFDLMTHNYVTGASVNADSTPTWVVFEEDTDATILNGNFTLRSAMTGNYRGTFAASTANGFEAEKFYTVRATCVVNSVTRQEVSLFFFVPSTATAASPEALDVSGTMKERLVARIARYQAKLVKVDAAVEAIEDGRVVMDDTGGHRMTFLDLPRLERKQERLEQAIDRYDFAQRRL